jgi:RNA polymerase sigma-70 factor, ECF subfamily
VGIGGRGRNLRLTRLRIASWRHNAFVDADRSFERIYRRHRREVYGSVLRDVRDPDEAEDVTQAAFLNAFRAMRRGDRPDKPRAWLLTIARNVVRRRAQLRAERPQEVELDSELLLTLDDEEGSASADIHAALMCLTDAQREAILLREIQGRSYAEIAFELGLSLSAVEALIFRARGALAEELQHVDRTPVVRERRRHGFLGLPALAKTWSLGFSVGRVGFACLVGCTVLATVPVRDGAASPEPAEPDARAPQAVMSYTPASEERAKPTAANKDKKRKDSTDGKESRETKPSTQDGSVTTDGSLVPVPLPALPSVEVPSVEVPSVEVPSVEEPVPLPSVELPPPPPLPEVDDVTELPSLTS